MKKHFVLTGFIAALSLSAVAQDYKTALGIRLGPASPAISSGFTIRHFLNESNALEGIVGISNGVGFCALYEWHHPIAAVDHLQWFVGAGGYAASRSHIGLIGAAGIVGLDYRFADIPLNLSLDWKPELNIIPMVGFESSGVGLSARFIF